MNKYKDENNKLLEIIQKYKNTINNNDILANKK